MQYIYELLLGFPAKMNQKTTFGFKPLVLFFLFMILISFNLSCLGQSAIQGIVKDNKGHALSGVSISLVGTYDGTLSDSLGLFHFKTFEKGEQTLLLKLNGYNSFEQKLNLSQKSIHIEASLKQQFNELKAVNINAGAFSAGDSKRGSILNAIDMATVAGSNADITSALKTLPGTSQVGEQEGLFVRGGTGAETKQFIDGTLVNNPYFASVPDISQRGRFSPFLFKGTVFSTGGYSAQYGEALSSVVLLQSIDLPEKSEIQTFFSPLVLGAGTQQLSKDKKSSFGLNYDYTNLQIYFDLVKQTPDYIKVPQIQSADANFRIKTKSGGIIKYYTTFSYSNLGLRRPDVDSLYLKDAFSLTNQNWYNNLSWKEFLPNGWKMSLGAGFSLNKDNIHQQIQDAKDQVKTFKDSVYWMNAKIFSVINHNDLTQLRAVFDKHLGGISYLHFGGEEQIAYNSALFNGNFYRFRDFLSAGFVESDLYLTNDLAAKLGVRYENSSVLRKNNIAPRVSIAYQTGKDAQVSAAYGVFFQKPENIQIFYTPQLDFTQATHYILNYQRISLDYTFRLEGYYKVYNRLIKEVPLYPNAVNLFTYNNSGTGYARGIDFFWRDKKTFKNLDYWISYSYLDTKRNFLNYTASLMPSFAAKHTLSIVTKRFFTDIKTGFNFTYSFSSPRPYYDFQTNAAGNGFYLQDQGLTPNNQSLNFSVNYLPSFGKKNAKAFVVWVASISNILGYNTIYGYNYPYQYGTPGNSPKQAIEPPAKRFFFIGCFISFGVDRSQDAINNNL